VILKLYNVKKAAAPNVYIQSAKPFGNTSTALMANRMMNIRQEGFALTIMSIFFKREGGGNVSPYLVLPLLLQTLLCN